MLTGGGKTCHHAGGGSAHDNVGKVSAVRPHDCARDNGPAGGPKKAPTIAPIKAADIGSKTLSVNQSRASDNQLCPVDRYWPEDYLRQ